MYCTLTFCFGKLLNYFSGLLSALPGSRPPWCELLRSCIVCPVRVRCRNCCPYREFPLFPLGGWSPLLHLGLHTTGPAADGRTQTTSSRSSNIQYQTFLVCRSSTANTCISCHSFPSIYNIHLCVCNMLDSSLNRTWHNYFRFQKAHWILL